MTVVESMKLAVRRLRRGTYSIVECETELARLIAEETGHIEDVDERIAAERKLKRRAWRMLLDATR